MKPIPPPPPLDPDSVPWYPGANGGVSFAVKAPKFPVRGHFWWDGNVLRLFDGAMWVITDPLSATAMGSPPPTHPFVGQQWFDGATLRIWDGMHWASVSVEGPVGPIGPMGPQGDPGPSGATDPSALLAFNPTSLNGGWLSRPINALSIMVQPYSCADSTGSVWLSRTAAITKMISAAWLPGNNQGGMGIGVLGNPDTWFHVFAMRAGSVTDVFIDTSPIGANRPSLTTAFRRIGSFKTNSIGAVRNFSQNGDVFTWLPEAGDTLNVINQQLPISSNGTASSFGNTLAPAGIVTGAMMNGVIMLSGGSGNNTGALIVLYPVMMGPLTPITYAGFTTAEAYGGTAFAQGFTATVQTDTNQSIGIGYQGSANFQIGICSLGWIDTRGKL